VESEPLKVDGEKLEKRKERLAQRLQRTAEKIREKKEGAPQRDTPEHRERNSHPPETKDVAAGLPLFRSMLRRTRESANGRGWDPSQTSLRAKGSSLVVINLLQTLLTREEEE
jgi:hypothetical protein